LFVAETARRLGLGVVYEPQLKLAPGPLLHRVAALATVAPYLSASARYIADAFFR